MISRKNLHLIFSPFRLLRLISPNRLRWLWYYIRTAQFAIIADHVKLLVDLGTAAPMELTLYSATDQARRLDFPAVDHPLVSILIPVYNQWEITRACLVSILENTVNISYEVIIGDDCSSDETRNIAHHTSNVQVAVNKTNLGFLKNCNHAAQRARGKYLVLLNNDTNVQSGWLQPLVELAERDEKVGLAGPMLLYPDGKLQEAGGIIWQNGSGCNYGRLDHPERAEYNYLKEVDYISGACILVRKSLWDEIGGFDERFAPAYYEDTDIAFEIRQRGYKVVYQPLSKIVHLEGISHGRDISSGVKSHQEINRIKFREKWAEILDARHGRDVRDIFNARDRSAGKKTLLFIDRHVPIYDQDAGSKSTFQYLCLMVEMGYRIIFIGDSFVAHQPYTNTLQQMGIEVLYSAWYGRHWKKWLSTHGRNFDYVYLSRPVITRKYLPLVKRYTSAKTFYCGHDLHWLREARRYEIEGDKAYLHASKKWEQWESEILRTVDMSYFFSDFEVDELRKRLPNVTVRAIPLFLFEEAELKETADAPKFEKREGLLFVGGFMHDPNVDAVCWFSREVLPLILEHIPDIVFTVVGTNPPAEVKRLANNNIIIKGRVSDDTLREHYHHCKVVVAPLRYGAGVKGKIVEAMRYGVPTVTTPIGAEGIGDATKALLIANNAETFANMVIAAYSDSILWEETTKQVGNAVRSHFAKATACAILAQDMPLSSTVLGSENTTTASAEG